MEKQMFCFQCEQTAGCSGCTGKAGVCGKTADTAGLQDELTGALIGLARACANNERKETTDRIIIEGLFTTVTNVAFDDESIRAMINKVNAEKRKIVPDCAGSKTLRRRINISSALRLTVPFCYKFSILSNLNPKNIKVLCNFYKF